MGLNVGTLVRPNGSCKSDNSSNTTYNGDVCVGIILEFDDPGKEFEPHIVLARVEWYHECELHIVYQLGRMIKGHLWYMVDDLWQIGQV